VSFCFALHIAFGSFTPLAILLVCHIVCKLMTCLLLGIAVVHCMQQMHKLIHTLETHFSRSR